MARENLNVTLHSAYCRYSAASETTGYRYTLICWLSMPMGILEAGKKQLGVWLQYACNVAEMSLYFSFGLLMVTWRILGGHTEVYASGNACCLNKLGRHTTFANEAGFLGLRIYVHHPMNMSLFFEAFNRQSEYPNNSKNDHRDM